ncbi:D-tyrosyl-tRNA(Tyr) deacylase [Kwoniella dendrophila CBS 6074]|uniref:D-aminoacyl-tRNA deacylase n=1 Tax=Kwoniella dendrophila CBS 6074 TaxID=1295534 RepID=A0AAX4K1Y6_9TREE
MKAVIQKVFSANNVVDGQTVSSIGKGLLVLVGIGREDEEADRAAIIKKILNIKLFEEEDGSLWKKSVQEIDGEVLCVSQFTLYAGFNKGAKPEFRTAMTPADSKVFFDAFLEEIKAAYKPDKIQQNIFGSTGTVSLVNDGPTTILLDSTDMGKKSKSNSASASASGTSTPAVVDPEAIAQKKLQVLAAKAKKKAEWEAKKESIKAGQIDQTEVKQDEALVKIANQLKLEDESKQ